MRRPPFRLKLERGKMKWLVKHEKVVALFTLILLIALVVQLKFCGAQVEPEITLQESQPRANQNASTPDASQSVAGKWEMSIKKRSGGAQVWTLTLEQKGETLKGVINSEGGDLDVSGTIKGLSVNLAAKRFGVIVEFPATLEGDTMKGTMRALTVTREWTATRK